MIFSNVSQGQHHLKGALMVPSQCHTLHVTIQEPSRFVYLVDFKTWVEPNRDCSKESAVRQFETVVFAPSVGVSFIATLDGKPLNIQVLEEFTK
ncbi:MAG: hypothetical protein G01um10148_860 [Parcubacteria group bacterium Gr01-1014_8]|nr:MAG: hypothetical protein G01um10148_860 [Parcubacteria group bacterium Gr01-1014_8]